MGDILNDDLYTRFENIYRAYSKNLEEREVIGVSDNDYVIYDNKTEQKIANVIKNMTTKDARHVGLSKRHLFRLKKKIKEGKKIVLEKKTLKKLTEIYV